MTEFARPGVGLCKSGLGRALCGPQAGSQCKPTPTFLLSITVWPESPDGLVGAGLMLDSQHGGQSQSLLSGKERLHLTILLLEHK